MWSVMRPVTAYARTAAALALVSAFTACAGTEAPVRNTTLILQFDQPHSERTLAVIRTELGTVMQNAGFTFDLKLFSELGPWAEFNDLMVVKLKGNCRLDDAPVQKASSSLPLALAHTTDGKVLPFLEVFCDQVRAVVRPALWGDQLRIPDALMGRALGRVIAHEIYHVITGTRHSATGIARHALSGPQLISDELFFQPEDIERMIQSSSAKRRIRSGT